MGNDVRERFGGFWLNGFLQMEVSKIVNDIMQLEILPYALAVAQSQSTKLNRFELLLLNSLIHLTSMCFPPHPPKVVMFVNLRIVNQQLSHETPVMGGLA